MRRRRFIEAAGAAGVAALAGCAAEQTDGGDGSDGGSTPDGENGSDGATAGEQDSEPATLSVATYEAFVDAPSTSPGVWLKETFESEFDAELEWVTPQNGVNQYVERANAGAEIEPDAYVGITTDDLIRVDENVDGELFVDPGSIEGREGVRETLQFDPNDRAIPYETGFVSLVYDENETEAPATFEGLLEEDHRGELLAQNPSSATTGRAFLLHTIRELGEDRYLDYWAGLQENDVRILGSWSDAYAAYENGEAPMVVSYSTDQVYANMSDADMSRHQIRFLNDQGYATPFGMSLFADAAEPELAREFMAFVLRPDVQGEIAERNVAFPAIEDAELSEEYERYAHEPPEPVTFTYEELRGNVSEWVDAWERQFAEN